MSFSYNNILFSSFVVKLDILETVRGLTFFLHIKRRNTKTNGFRYVECGENCRREILLHGMGGGFPNSNGVEVC